MTKEDQLFQQGIRAFNERRFYDAHEYWEELWLDYKLDDAKFIQGLIQLAVSYFHLFNQNLNGSRSMMRKCMSKFKGFEFARGIDVNDLIRQIIQAQSRLICIETILDIKDSYILTLKVEHE